MLSSFLLHRPSASISDPEIIVLPLNPLWPPGQANGSWKSEERKTRISSRVRVAAPPSTGTPDWRRHRRLCCSSQVSVRSTLYSDSVMSLTVLAPGYWFLIFLLKAYLSLYETFLTYKWLHIWEIIKKEINVSWPW